MTKIFTLNARDTVIFDVLLKLQGVTFLELGPQIRSLHESTIRQLETGGVSYAALRTALVPSTTTSELALVFDTVDIESSFYGVEVAARLLPLLGRTWNGSILAGDLIHPNQDAAITLLQRSLSGARPVSIYNTGQLYAVYLTNLTPAQVSAILQGIREYRPFVGSVDATYESPIKDWLSLTLVNVYVKNQDTFISQHPEDDGHVSDQNSGSWPLEDHDYRSVSVPTGSSFDPFLSYKIERAVEPRFETDTLHGLSAISGAVTDLGDFRVVVEPAKLRYLQQHKSGSLELADLSAVTPGALAQIIEARLQRNYIYELDYLAEHDVSKFNLVIQVAGKDHVGPVKLVVALEYKPADRELRLITMF